LSDVIIERGKGGEVIVNKKKSQNSLERTAAYMAKKQEKSAEQENENMKTEIQDKIKEENSEEEEEKRIKSSHKKIKGKSKKHKGTAEIKENSNKGITEVVGFMPLRGDFNIEYDNDAELLLADMEFFDDDTKSEQDLKYEILKLYNTKLDERIRRRNFVIEKGLLDIKKQQQIERKKPKEEREIYNQMKPYMRFCEDNEFNELVEGLIEEKALRQRLEELKMFKSLNMDTFDKIDKYIEKKRIEGLEQNAVKTGGNSPTSGSRSSRTNRVPRAKENANQIAQAPKYDELDDKEKEICILLTLQPAVYLDIKKKLISKQHQKLYRSNVLDYIDQEITKDKAFVIFDYLVLTGAITTKNK